MGLPSPLPLGVVLGYMRAERASRGRVAFFHGRCLSPPAPAFLGGGVLPKV